jgi:hypothetical protein
MNGNFNDIIHQVMAAAKGGRGPSAKASVDERATNLAIDANQRVAGVGEGQPSPDMLMMIIQDILASMQPDSNQMQGGAGPTVDAAMMQEMQQ